MSQKLRWGVLGAAKIARNRVIPAIIQSSNGVLSAIASRSQEKADEIAEEFNIPHAFSSYEALIESDVVDAVYIPLPNHLHVEYAIKAAKAGKHVLCEKPIAMSAEEAGLLLAVRESTGVVIQEAFMVMTNPAWSKAKELVDNGSIGELKTVIGNFSYMNTDPSNVRNVPEYGGGALMDVGCYLVLASRYFFNDEPISVSGASKIDEHYGVDILTSASLEFEKGTAIITCSTQAVPAQMLYLEGTAGRIRFDIPFSQPADKPAVLFLDQGKDIFSMETTRVEIPPFNHYVLHVERFVDVVWGKSESPIKLEDSISNMCIIDMIR